MRSTHPCDPIRSPAHRRSHSEPNRKNPQKQPLGRLPGLLVWRKNSRNVLRRSYNAKPQPIHHNQTVLLPSVHSSILSNSQKQIAPLSVMHHSLTLLIQQLRMDTSTIQNLLCQSQPENGNQNQNLWQCHRSQNRASVSPRRNTVR